DADAIAEPIGGDPANEADVGAGTGTESQPVPPETEMEPVTPDGGVVPENAIAVEDFGARGDGVTDDSGALRAALNGAAGRPLAFTRGKTYRIASSVSASPAASLAVFGSGATLDARG